VSLYFYSKLDGSFLINTKSFKDDLKYLWPKCLVKKPSDKKDSQLILKDFEILKLIIFPACDQSVIVFYSKLERSFLINTKSFKEDLVYLWPKCPVKIPSDKKIFPTNLERFN